jgi:restriction endonuclease S subunit
MNRWPKKPLGELVDFIGGGTPRRDRPEYWGGDIPWASVKDLQSQSLESTAESITREGLAKSTSNLIPEGTVIIATRVGLGKAAINRIPVAINQDLKALTPKSKDLLPRYLLYFFLSKAKYLEQAGVGATVKGLTIADYQKINFVLPPLREQERIVKLLDEADELRKLRALADRRTAALIPALFHEMFGDVEQYSKGWPTKAVGEVGDLVRGSSPRPKSDPRYYGGPIPRLMIEDITRDGWSVTPRVDSLTELGATMSRPVKAGTIVMAVSGNIGLCAQLAVDACIHDGFVAFKNLREDLFVSLFFGIAMSQMREAYQRNRAGAIFQNITTSDVKAMKVQVPPLSLQKEFARRVTEIREIEAEQTLGRRRLDALLQSLLYGAFAGDL